MENNGSEHWFDMDEEGVCIRAKLEDGNQIRLDFFNMDAIEKVRRGSKNKISNKDKIAPHIITNDAEFLGKPWWQGRIKNNLVNSPASGFENGDATSLINRFCMMAEDDVKRLIENNKNEQDTERDEEYPDWLDEKAEKLLYRTNLLLIIDDVIHDRLAGEHQNAMTNFTTCVSTLTEEPMNLRWSGRSSTGKTAITTASVHLIPDEWKMVYMGMTEKSLYYDPKNEEISPTKRKVDLKNKVMVILEESNAREFLQQAKPVLSHDQKEHSYGFTDTSGASPVRKDIILSGWPAYIGLSVEPEGEIELGTRELTSTPKMGQNKYGRVVDWKALKGFAPWIEPDDSKLKIVKHALRKLERKKVWIPFMPIIRKNFPALTARSQRDWDKLESAIKTIALLHQYQRDVLLVSSTDGEDEKSMEMVVAEPFDAIIASHVIEGAISQAMIGLNRDQIDFHNHIKKESNRREKTNWTYNNLMDEYKRCFGESIGRSTIERRYINEYINLGVMSKDESSKQHKMKITSPLMSNITSLKQMRNELREVEIGPDYLEKQFKKANDMWSQNGVKMSVSLAPETDGPSKNAVINEIQDRFVKLDNQEPIDWEKELEVDIGDDLEFPDDDELEFPEEVEKEKREQRELMKKLNEFYYQNYGMESVHVKDFAVPASQKLGESKERIIEACKHLQEDKPDVQFEWEGVE